MSEWSLAIPLENSVAHSVSTTDYLFARSVPHRGDSRDGRSGLVDISQRLGRDLSMVGHSASDPGVAWRTSSWAAHTIRIPLLQIALQYVLVHRAIEGGLRLVWACTALTRAIRHHWF